MNRRNFLGLLLALPFWPRQSKLEPGVIDFRRGQRKLAPFALEDRAVTLIREDAAGSTAFTMRREARRQAWIRVYGYLGGVIADAKEELESRELGFPQWSVYPGESPAFNARRVRWLRAQIKLLNRYVRNARQYCDY